MSETPFDKLLDASGLSCPMPLVKARNEIGAMKPGEILKVLSTDRGSVKDFQGWASVAKDVELVAQETLASEGKPPVHVHFVRHKR
jgi:TusA-related sulfurtransferase